MEDLKRILLVEDALKDVGLPFAAPAEHNLANEVAVKQTGICWARINQPPLIGARGR